MIAKLIDELRTLHEKPWIIFTMILLIVFTINGYGWLTKEPEEAEQETTETAPQSELDPSERPSEGAGIEANPEEEPEKVTTTPQPQPEAAKTTALSFPLDCTYNMDCWTARYMDRGEGRRKQDFQCQAATQDKHKGTDYVIADLPRMRDGVAVLAAADGTVLRRRDGVEDISARERDKSSFAGVNCGNAVIIDHGNGWETQYCHMRRGSVRANVGDTVKAGDPIGQVGLSGETEYPHLHFMVRKDGVDLDPYDGGIFEQDCNAGDGPLWANAPGYDAMTLLPVYFTSEAPSRDNVWEGGVKTLPADSPALILTGRAFHTSEADRWYFTITAPDGSVFFENRFMINQDKQFYFHFGGKRAPEGGFMPGVWKGELRVVREEGGAPIIQRAEVMIGG